MADLATPTREGLGSPLASIAVVGGSGFYEFLEDAEEFKLDTPFGAPSDPITVGEVAGRQVAFLPRHGRDHRFPPHKIPYRANIWALRSLGVRRSEEHTSELQSRPHLVCRLLLEKKKKHI